MTDLQTPPLLAASTERLAAALHEVSFPCAHYDGVNSCERKARDLIASGAVVPAASLADDEALVDAVAGGMFAAQSVTDLGEMARVALRALAAALEDR